MSHMFLYRIKTWQNSKNMIDTEVKSWCKFSWKNVDITLPLSLCQQKIPMRSLNIPKKASALHAFNRSQYNATATLTSRVCTFVFCVMQTGILVWEQPIFHGVSMRLGQNRKTIAALFLNFYSARCNVPAVLPLEKSTLCAGLLLS